MFHSALSSLKSAWDWDGSWPPSPWRYHLAMRPGRRFSRGAGIRGRIPTTCSRFDIDWKAEGIRSARQATREGFEMDDEILTVFERFELVWPLDVAV